MPHPNQSRTQYRAQLLTWYDVNKRDLPWRKTLDPYAIWVSEIMLQQTQVATVIPYFDKFMTAFPTPFELAAASEDEVMRHWSGLGYYRRARLLHEGVRDVVANYDGQVPRNASERKKLRGVGRYTSGAIGSIAFDQPEPIVDGNVARVFSRFYGLDAPLESKRMQEVLWEKAGAWAAGERPGDLNQALMELGATVCTKHNPLCKVCPLRNGCDAFATERVNVLPRPKERKAPTELHLAALVATDGDDVQNMKGPRVWLAKQSGSLFGGLWNVPMVETGDVSTNRWPGTVGLVGVVEPRPCGTIKHQLTHRTLHVSVWRASNAKPHLITPDLQAFDLSQTPKIGTSTLTKKLIAFAFSSPQRPAKHESRGKQQ